MEHEGDSDTNCSWCTWNSSKCMEGRLGEQEIRGRILTIQTTALRSARILGRKLKRLAVTWTSRKNYPLKLVWITLKKKIFTVKKWGGRSVASICLYVFFFVIFFFFLNQLIWSNFYYFTEISLYPFSCFPVIFTHCLSWQCTCY